MLRNRINTKKICCLKIFAIVTLMSVLGKCTLSSVKADGITVCTEGCNFTTIQEAIDSIQSSSDVIINVMDSTHTEADINVDKDVIIQGEGALETIVQASDSIITSDQRVFYIHQKANVKIQNLTIQHGNPKTEPESGGGIRNDGSLALKNVIIKQNSASAGGGILNNGQLILIGSTVESNEARGGAIHYIECSTGGGIKVQEGITTLVNSTVRNNIAIKKGGGLHVACLGKLNMENSTISGNTSAGNGGGIYLDGVGFFTHSTISNNTGRNGGGLFLQDTWEKDLIRGTLHFTATVIADNIATLEKYGVPDCYLGENSNIEANEHNLIENGTCESVLSGDPLLDSRWLGKIENSSNGNVYSTETHALQSESILIDAIPDVECNINVDQIGNLRPQGSGCDIGAYELPQEGNIFHLENLKVAYIVGGLLIITSIILVIFFRQKHKYRF